MGMIAGNPAPSAFPKPAPAAGAAHSDWQQAAHHSAKFQDETVRRHPAQYSHSWRRGGINE